MLLSSAALSRPGSRLAKPRKDAYYATRPVIKGKARVGAKAGPRDYRGSLYNSR